MAATKSQGKGFTLFMAGLTIAAAGMAYFSSGSGKFALIVGLAALAASFIVFLKIKPEEGPVATKSQPFVHRLIGVAAVFLGWFVTLYGLHLSDALSARMMAALFGLLVSLVGSLYLLPSAANKNAIWKG